MALLLTILGVGMCVALEAVVSGGPLVEAVDWLPSLGVELGIRLDALSTLFAALILFVSAAVFAYIPRYFQGDPPGALAALLPLFVLAMLGIVLADDAVFLVLAWEATSITSWLLIAQAGKDAGTQAAARRALLVTAFGGLALLAGLLLLVEITGTTAIGDMVAQGALVGDHPLTPLAAVLVLLGVMTKSAQFPFSFWLPGAMAAPAPVSALLHSATMVKAGVYLMLRLGPVFVAVPLFGSVLVVAGLITAIVAAWRAWFATDAKRLLAFTTLSALGTLTVLASFGTPAAAQAALILLVAHALYKAPLFLAVGQMEKGIGTRDMDQVRGLVHALPGVAAVFALASASMAGLPPFLGFVAKEYAYESALGVFDSRPWILLGLVLANVALVGVSLRLGWNSYRRTDTPPTRTKKAFGSPGVLFMAIAGLALGLSLLSPLSGVIQTATAQLGFTEATPAPPKLWHGLTPALGWSVLTVLLGVALFLRGHRRPAPASTTSRDAAARFDAALEGSLAFLRRAGAWVVPRNTGRHVHLIVLALVAVAVLLAPWSRIGDLEGVSASDPLAWSMLPVALGGLLLVGRARTYLGTVVGMTTVGFATALLFLRMGGADLAATQFAVEALGGLFLVLVLKELSLRARMPHPAARVAHSGLAFLLGLAVFAILAASLSTPPVEESAGAELAQLSLPEGGGRNVVNVILVDVRALDTLGEILVLLVAALTVLGLYTPAGRRHRRPPLLLHQTSALALPLLVMLGTFLFLRGHHEPGGGFVGGLVIAASLAVVGMGRGHKALKEILPVPPLQLATIGGAVALVSFIPGWISTGVPGATLWLSLELPIAGKIGTPTLFDLGVLLLVVGMVVSIVSRFLED